MGDDDSRRAAGLDQLLVSGLQRVLRSSPLAEPAEEGLRERKKRLMRRQISDVATAMFFERGFDEVKVSEIAEACGISEKTVFNYFPTKEALLLDREDEMADQLRRVLGPGSAWGSPVDAICSLLHENLTEVNAFFVPGTDGSGTDGRAGIERFIELVEQTPSLRAAQFDLMERLAQVAAVAMAARAGVNPDDPEPQIAADALVALWRISWRGIRRHAASARSAAELRDAVSSEVRRAARLIDTGLWSFGLAVQGANGRQQFQAAAEAANEARKQVITAIRQAREAWLALKIEARQHPASAVYGLARERDQLRAVQRAANQARREAQEASRELRRAVKDAARRGRADAEEIRRSSKKRGSD